MDVDLDALERSAYAESLPLFHERATPAAVLELIRRLRAADARLHEVSTHCANVEAECDALRAELRREIERSRAVKSAADELRAERDALLSRADKFGDGIDWIQRAMQAEDELKAMKQQKPIAWRAVGGSIWGHKTSPDDVPLFEAAGAQQPVAWTAFPPAGHYTSLSGEAEKWAANGWSVVPLCLAPVAQPAQVAELAASQAREMALREAVSAFLAFAGRNGELVFFVGGWPSINEMNECSGLARAALALHADDTALRAALVKAQEEMRERAAAVCEEVMTGGIAAYATAIRELEAKP